MTQSKTVKAGSVSLPDAKGDVTIDMHTIKEFAESLTAASSSIFTASNSFSATTYADGTWWNASSATTTGHLYDINLLSDQTLWEERLPGINEVNALAEEYPAFAKAYEQFRNAYNLVIDDWKSKDE